MALLVRVFGPAPSMWRALDMSGFRRPLNGEAANLTLTLDLSAADRADWQDPPLGTPTRVSSEAGVLLDGVVSSVKWTAAAVVIGVEG